MLDWIIHEKRVAKLMEIVCKMKNFSGREKKGNFIFSQGILEKNREKTRN